MGVVGLGFMGQVHAGNAEQFGHDVVGGADVDEGKRRAFADQFGAPTYEDYGRLYDEATPDAVAIAVPNRFHEPATVAALDRGIDVLCEKPLAHTLESAERIAAAAGESDAFLTVGFSNRFSPAAVGFENHQAEGRFGDLTHVEANYVRRRGIPNRGTWFTDADLAGGGALVDIGVHAVDFALFLLGHPDVVEVKGVTRSNFGMREEYTGPDHWETDVGAEEFDVEDAAHAFVHCEDDATIALDIAWAAERRATKRIVVRGTEGGAELAVGGDELELYHTIPGSTNLEVNPDAAVTLEHTGWAGEMEAFLDSVAAGEPPVQNPVDEALTVQRVVDAIYRSSASGEAVTLD